jgi:hypothetical protein
MDQLWLMVGIAIVIVLLAFVFLIRRKRTNRENALATLGIVFVVTGIVFGDDDLLGYSSIGV